MLHVVLVEPEIPPNTGNIARLCLAMGARLHLVEPLGFSLSDKALRRAGMDYWHACDIHVWPDFPAWSEAHPDLDRWFFTTKTTRACWSVGYTPETALIFGRETRGLPESLLQANSERLLTIPMSPEARSLNLSTAAAIGAYEYLRQHSPGPAFRP
jgi:tRNA (cytidine/uridine-2'-O-)-methyltransferase